MDSREWVSSEDAMLQLGITDSEDFYYHVLLPKRIPTYSRDRRELVNVEDQLHYVWLNCQHLPDVSSGSDPDCFRLERLKPSGTTPGIISQLLSMLCFRAEDIQSLARTNPEERNTARKRR
jgi:hypothetical protein